MLLASYGCQEKRADVKQVPANEASLAARSEVTSSRDTTRAGQVPMAMEPAPHEKQRHEDYDPRADPSSINIVLSCHIEAPEVPFDSIIVAMLITDPIGRRTGLDASTQQLFTEIPHGWYEDNIIEDPMEEGVGAAWRILEIMGPMTGPYALSIYGTGEGTYDLSLRCYDTHRESRDWEIDDIPTKPGEVHAYAVHFVKTASSSLSVRGGFSGGGETDTADGLLTYASVAGNETHLTRTREVNLLILYAETIEPGKFEANLDGVTVSDLFSPVAGGSELVNLPVHTGENVLVLSVEGEVPGSKDRLKDTDRLIFRVADEAESRGQDR